jgi:hypothetical protein
VELDRSLVSDGRAVVENLTRNLNIEGLNPARACPNMLVFLVAIFRAGNTEGGKYHCTVDLLFEWFGISCMTTDNFCSNLQNRLIQTKQEVNGTVILPPLVFPVEVVSGELGVMILHPSMEQHFFRVHLL